MNYYAINGIPARLVHEIAETDSIMKINETQYNGLKTGLLRISGGAIVDAPQPSPAQQLEQAKTIKLQELERAYIQRMENGFAWQTTISGSPQTFWFRMHSEQRADYRDLFTKYKDIDLKTDTDSCVWFSKSGAILGKTFGDYKVFIKSYSDLALALIGEYNFKKTTVEQATSIAVVNAIPLAWSL
jgi:hypothetical protein